MVNPKRVLCLFTLLDRGGAETMCMNLYRNIDRTKIQFDFLVYYPQRGQYEDEIEHLGGRVYRIPHLDPKNLLKHIKGAREFFKGHPEYNIVHNHMGENGAFICCEAKRAGVKTIIYHSHVDKVSIFNILRVAPFPQIYVNRKQLKLQLLYPLAMWSATDFFACGSNAAKVFGKNASKVHILNNAIDVQKFAYSRDVREAKRQEMKCGDKLIIGNVARINDNKNQTFAIRVMKEILKDYDNVELWFIGDGNRRQELMEQVKEEHLSEKIKFLGVRSDVNELMQAMDVFLFPSIKEGLPVSCIEAQAAGLPCVFSDGFDSNTVITNNCTVLSLQSSVKQWASVILAQKGFERKNIIEVITAAGYDIHETAKTMQQFYLTRK